MDNWQSFYLPDSTKGWRDLPETKNTGLITTIDTNSEKYQEELN